jgi:hypothetical protein
MDARAFIRSFRVYPRIFGFKTRTLRAVGDGASLPSFLIPGALLLCTDAGRAAIFPGGTAALSGRDVLRGVLAKLLVGFPLVHV